MQDMENNGTYGRRTCWQGHSAHHQTTCCFPPTESLTLYISLCTQPEPSPLLEHPYFIIHINTIIMESRSRRYPLLPALPGVHVRSILKSLPWAPTCSHPSRPFFFFFFLLWEARVSSITINTPF